MNFVSLKPGWVFCDQDAFDSFDDSEWLAPWCRMSTYLSRFLIGVSAVEVLSAVDVGQVASLECRG